MTFFSDLFGVADEQNGDEQHELKILKEKYHLDVQPVENWNQEKSHMIELDPDLTAHFLGAVQPLQAVVSNKAVADSFEGAIRFVVPADLPEGARLLDAKKLGPGASYGDYYIKRPDGSYSFVGKGGFEEFDTKTADLVQLSSAVFAAASIVTQQYFLQRIDAKLEKIQQNTRDILQFLELDKRTRLQSQDRLLTELYHNAQKIMGCPVQRQASVVTVQNIRVEAQSAVLFYQMRIDENTKLAPKETTKQVLERLEKVAQDIPFYWYALQIYCRATVLELLLSENRDHDYLQYIRQDLYQRCAEYQSCFQQWYQNADECIQTIGINKITAFLLKNAGVAVAGAAAGITPFGMAGAGGAASFAYQSIDSIIKQHDEQTRKKAQEKYTSQTHQYAQAEQILAIADSVEALDHMYHTPREFVLCQDKLYLKDSWLQEAAEA